VKSNTDINTKSDLELSLGRARKYIADELRDNQEYKSHLLNLAKREDLDLTELTDFVNTPKFKPFILS